MVDLGGSLAVASRGLFATGVSTDLSGKQVSSLPIYLFTCLPDGGRFVFLYEKRELTVGVWVQLRILPPAARSAISFARRSRAINVRTFPRYTSGLLEFSKQQASIAVYTVTDKQSY